jgi:hypothetical protein
LSQASFSKKPASGGIEQRQARRRKVLLTGKIVYGEGAYVLDCTIGDISATGARVYPPQGRTIPAEVFLIDMVNRTAYEAVTVSTRAGGFGLKFLKTLPLGQLTAPELRYLKLIWLDSAR